MVLMGLRSLVESDPGLALVGGFTDGAEAFACIRDQQPDVAVLDVNMPTMGGVSVLQSVRATNSSCRIILLAAHFSDDDIVAAVQFGARCIMPKDAVAGDLIKCIRTVAGGATCLPPNLLRPAMARVEERQRRHRWLEELLTAREYEIFALAATGLPNKVMAGQIGVTEGTIKLHLNNIYTKLEISSRGELVRLARSLET
ncbi:hypothetical protein CH341_04495 [Rhodoplanes roseus]|uniref:DNA-binding response regulator n=1 Tax=Rhodoplanes roseus TaxID=29409 RepID=A0A327L320_9BRAD|nr:hypothetical protein CH341_04495 [Rhodoplanes roseus]